MCKIDSSAIYVNNCECVLSSIVLSLQQESEGLQQGGSGIYGKNLICLKSETTEEKAAGRLL